MRDEYERVEVDGLKELRRALKGATGDLKDLKEAHLKAAQIAAEASAALAPARPGSGKLKATIRAAGQARSAVIRAGRASVPYAGPIHWGWNRTRAKKRNPKIRGGSIKAQPFLSRGARNSEGDWLPVYERALDGIVRKIERETK